MNSSSSCGSPVAVSFDPRPTVASVFPSGMRSDTRAGALAKVSRAMIGSPRPNAFTVASSSGLGSQPVWARRTSSWWMYISPMLPPGPRSLTGEQTGGAGRGRGGVDGPAPRRVRPVVEGDGGDVAQIASQPTDFAVRGQPHAVGMHAIHHRRIGEV